VSSQGALINSGTGSATASGSLTLAANASVGSNYVNALSGVAQGGSLVLTGVVGGNYALTKVGANTLVLSGPNAQNGLTINEGTVLVNGSGYAQMNGAITLNAGQVSGLNFANRLRFDNTVTAVNTRNSGGIGHSLTLTSSAFELVGNATTAVTEFLGTGN
jgi:hypothetical protein